MNEETIIFFLCFLIGFLICIILYERFAFKRVIESKIKRLASDLKNIKDSDTSEKVMVFTDNKALMELAAQINSMLENTQKIKAEYKHSQTLSKKMLSNISHDIKTPLTVILGYLELIRIQNAKDNQMEMIEKVEQKAQSVMELINQFFSLAKLEAGDTDMQLSKININEICRGAILDFYEILVQKQFEVDISIPDNSIFVLGNKNAMDRILFNLISNVIRYGADGKYLGISLREEEKFIFIDVVDKGKGIEKNFAKNVFERLYTMEDSRNKEIQGNGLGLTIAKNLTLQMNGDITLESIPNRKTSFTIKLKKF